MTAADIDALEDFFKAADIPKEIQLSKGVKILNAPASIPQHIDYLRRTPPGQYTTEPRYQDLLRLRMILSGELNHH